MNDNGDYNVNLKASAPFKRWLVSVAARDGSTEVDVIERALRIMAEREGLEQPPKRVSRPWRRPMPA